MGEIKNLKKVLEQKQSVLVYACYLIAYITRKMDEKFKKFTTLMMDIGEVKVQFRNYLEHQTQQKKRQKNG